MEELVNAYSVTKAELAAVTGYNRSAFRRLMMNRQIPRMDTVWQLAQHFGVAVEFFFPACDGEARVFLPPARDCVCDGATPMARQVLADWQKLPLSLKREVLKYVTELSRMDVREVHAIRRRLVDAGRTLSPEDQEKLLHIIAQWRQERAGP